MMGDAGARSLGSGSSLAAALAASLELLELPGPALEASADLLSGLGASLAALGSS